MTTRTLVRAPLCVALAASLTACFRTPSPETDAGAALVKQLAGAGEAHAQAAAPPALPARARSRPDDPAPPVIRGIYVNAYAAGNPVRRKELLALTDSTELNTWVVDVKDEDGVRYPSALPLAVEATHVRSIPIRNLRGLADTLRAHGIHPIARIVVFKDPRLSRARPDWSIRQPSGGLWHDKVGNTWVNPWDRRVWDYNLAIAEEAVRAGFREVQFDYVRFPEAYRSLPTQVFPTAVGKKADAITGFLAEAGARLHPLGASITADVFGLTMNDPLDVGIGQQWERVSSTVDHVLPMVYPSHYFPTHLPGIRRPNRMPYETVFASVGQGVIRSRRLESAGVKSARIVPWLQAFTATWNDRAFRYGPAQARAQTQAVYDLGLEDWIFWNPNSNYDAVAAGFERSAVGRAKPFVPPVHMARQVDVLDREGAAAARQLVASQPSGALGQ
ncbi:MAG TPA: putative glycoside hydrolase [Longimicrobium sp.]